MVIIKFLRPEFNRVFQEELIDTKFATFGEGLVIMSAFSRYSKTCKNTYISYGSIRNGRFISLVLDTQSFLALFCCLMVQNNQK